MNLFYGISLLVVLLHTSYSFHIHHQSTSKVFNFNSNNVNNNIIKNNNYIILRCTGTPNIVDEAGASTDSKSSLSELIEATETLIIETPEEKYKREKLAEIAERKAEEVFVTRTTGKSC